ncbi:cytochrome P450 [Streptomyces sp. B6B3]|uniref:cytochrome P450 family protein n=1 Tax=Streptomyces sp. B6B3 TaxID=3153570 RepID=UPI00325D1918
MPEEPPPHHRPPGPPPDSPSGPPHARLPRRPGAPRPAFGRGDTAFAAAPHAALARLRGAAPVHHIVLPDGSAAWLVTRDADVRRWLSDPRLSHNKRHSRAGYRGFSLPPALDANLLNSDPEDHIRLRRLVGKGFTPRHVAALAPTVEATARRCADALRHEIEAAAEPATEPETADLVTGFAAPLPLAVIGDLFALPEPDRRPFAGWVSTMISPQRPEDVSESVAAIHQYLTDLVAARRATPGPADDLLSSLVAARDGSDQLSEDELVSLAFLILGAGIENVQHTLSAGMLALLREPDQLAALRAERDALLPGAVEELLRHAHPNLMAIRRFTTEAVEIAGSHVPRGETVLLCLASANRDPERYAEPDRFDIRRTDHGHHLALGHGMHYCLGAPLARLQLRLALTALLDGLPSLALAAEEPRWSTSFRSHALTRLAVTSAPSPGARP